MIRREYFPQAVIPVTNPLREEKMNRIYPLRFWAIALTCLIFTGCRQAELENTSPSFITPAVTEQDSTPEEIPFKPYRKPAQMSDLEKSMYEIMEKYQIAGLQAAVTVGESLVWKGAFGWFDMHREIPMQNDHMNRIASISKSFAGLTAMKLVGEGKLNLDEDINNYLDLPVLIRNPHYPDVPITARQLMNHTSGILNGQYVEYVVAARAQNPVTITLADYFAENGEFNKPENWSQTRPGEKFNYSNMGPIVLAAVIEKLSGREFNACAREAAFNPLNMQNSSFNPLELDPARIAKMYRRQERDGQVFFTWTPVPPGASLEGYIPGTNGGLCSPQGGMVSNAADMSRFVIAMSNHGKVGGVQIFSRELIDAMHQQSVQVVTGEESPGTLYKKKGLYIHITDDLLPDYTFYGHAGNAYGIITDMYYTMDQPVNFGFVIILNGCNMSKRSNRPFYSIEDDILALLYERFISTDTPK